jgi:hypothetical protein
MKSFAEFLTESKKTYAFKIGVAGPLPEGFQERLEMGLKKYDVASLSKGKKTPIQERPLDFPNLQNMEVTYFEAEVSYPTTVQVLHEYLSQLCSVNRTHIIVRSGTEPQELYQSQPESDTYEALLTKEDLGGVDGQKSVGGNRVMELLKELEKVRKEREHEPAGEVKPGASKQMDNKQNTKSVIGN